MSRPALALAVLPLSSCGLRAGPVLDPQGPLGAARLELLRTAFGLMLIVVVPVIVLTLWFAWLYRATAPSARYEPTWDRSRLVEAVIWVVPSLIVAALGTMVWRSTFALDPSRPIEGHGPAVEVQAIAQDWKWLFVYPEQGIASANLLVFPAGRPLSLRITSDTVMNALIIPALGGQIYAMAGMETRLNLLADDPGDFMGRNAMFSGEGFPDQTFVARAVDAAAFDAWVARARQAPPMTPEAYAALAAPGTLAAPILYGRVPRDLFQTVVDRHGGDTMTMQEPRLP